MTGAWNDYNDAESQNSYDLIPKGTIVPVRMTLKPGGYDDPSQGWTGGYATRNETTGSVYLNAEFVVLEGAHARRKIWSLIGLLSLKGTEWGNMGRSFVRGILNSARGLSDKDNSPQAQTTRRINGFADLDGIEFLAKIDVGKDANGDAKNEIRFAVTPGSKDWKAFQENGGLWRPAGAAPTVSSSSASATPASPPAANPGRPAGRSRKDGSMLLRPRQKVFVERDVDALDEHGNTLGVAPTGAGKTIMLSGVVGRMLEGNDARAAVLAHRDELTAQNVLKFAKVNPKISTSIIDSRTKSWRGRTTFAMVPTLARSANLDAMPALDLLVIDEAHHVAADSYRRIIDKARDRNPDVRVFGVTATPNRGDKKGLRPVFSNVADQITIGELIASGHLVPPRTFVIDVGAQEALKSVRKTVDDFDMKAVDAIMNKAPITEAVIRHWREKAGERQTVVFCFTVDHARNVTDAFLDEGITAGMVHGDVGEAERRSVLRSFEKSDTQVIVNVAVLTEGWDHQPTSCVVLLRPSSYKSTMIQMVGRGLRTVDPNEFPGVVKTDCIVLDFGTSTLLHGCLEQDVNLDGKTGDGEAPTKDCPECSAQVPLAVRECPLCGYLWESVGTADGEVTPLTDFVMSEIDLLKRSSFRWCDLFGDDAALVANGFSAWGGIFFLHGRWHAVGGAKGQRSRLLAVGERTVCLAAADDWLNENETDESAHKTRSWLNQPATERQLKYLPSQFRQDFGLTRYQASALLTFQFNKGAITNLVASATDVRRAA